MPDLREIDGQNWRNSQRTIGVLERLHSASALDGVEYRGGEAYEVDSLAFGRE